MLTPLNSLFVVILIPWVALDCDGVQDSADQRLSDQGPDGGEKLPCASTRAGDEVAGSNSSDCSIGPSEDQQLAEGSTGQLSKEQWQTRVREKQRRLFAIKREILERLGLTHRPVAPNVSLTPEEQTRFEDYLKQTESRERLIYHRDFYSKRYQTLAPSCSHPRGSDNSSWQDVPLNEMRLFFPVDPIDSTNRNRETRISVANLKLRKITPGPESRTTASWSSEVKGEDSVIRVTVYAYTKSVRRGRREQKKFIGQVFVNRNSGPGWTLLDIRSAVEDWARRPHRNYGLVVTADDHDRSIDPHTVFERINCSTPMVITFPSVLNFPISGIDSESSSSQADTHVTMETGGSGSSQHASQLPPTVLDVVTVDVPKRRSHRSYRDLQTFSSRSLCAVEKMFVSFADLGWSDWIVQPNGFETGFCRGSCSTRSTSTSARSSTSTSTTAKSTIDLMSLGLSECCGPVRAKSLSVLQYNDKGKLSISVLDDFIVTECDCRR